MELNNSTHDNIVVDELQRLPPQFIWSSDSIEPFNQAMTSSDVKYLINKFSSKDFSLFKKGINDTAQQEQNSFDKAASLSLKLKLIKRKTKKRNVCSKKWFDYDCKKARKELRQISNQKHSDPLNIALYNREQYHLKLKSFKQLLQSKKKEFHANKLLQLENNSENTEFWRIHNSGLSSHFILGGKPILHRTH